MKWLCLLALALTLTLAHDLPAAQSAYIDGKIVKVQDKAKTTVLYYQVDTPVTRDDPYYEIMVQLKDTTYTGVYTPRHPKDLLPAEWIPGADVKVKIEGRRMTLLTPVGNEIETAIAARRKSTTQVPASVPVVKQ